LFGASSDNFSAAVCADSRAGNGVLAVIVFPPKVSDFLAPPERTNAGCGGARAATLSPGGGAAAPRPPSTIAAALALKLRLASFLWFIIA
jgi:hypothetical protein